jgi:hypothetical protein
LRKSVHAIGDVPQALVSSLQNWRFTSEPLPLLFGYYSKYKIVMLKFLLILGIIVYLIYKIGSFFFRAGAASQQFRNFQQQQPPGNGSAKTKKTKFKGGEYIDYEEVK